MSGAPLWAFIVVAGLVTYLLRISFILLVGEGEIPPLARRALRYVPAAALAALVAPALLYPEGALFLSLTNVRLVAGLVAALVAWRTRNVLATIVVGMMVLWGLQGV